MHEEALDRSALEPYRTIGDGTMLGNMVRLFQSGTTAGVEDVAAAAGSDTEAVRMAAHKMRGEAATVGAMKLARLAQDIEQAARDGSLPSPEEVDALREAVREANDLLARAFGD